MILSGIIDLDSIILNKLDDESLFNLCKSNSYCYNFSMLRMLKS